MASFLKKNIIILAILFFCLAVLFCLDKVLSVGIIFLAFLSFAAILMLKICGLKDRILIILFGTVLLINFAVVLFVHYADFQPFSGGEGDYLLYDQQAKVIATRIWQGDFSLQGLNITHYYPVIVGYIYALTLQKMLMGQLFNVWLAAIAVIFVYLIIGEIGGSKISSFLISLIVSIYPSYLFYGSLLLKERVVILLVLSGLFFSLKLIKQFSYKKLIVFFVILTCLVNLRFYIGYALLLAFIFCWLLLTKLNLKKRLIYGTIMIFLLGVPFSICGYGYYGFKVLKHYLSYQQIVFYRETAYAPSAHSLSGIDSSVVIKTDFDRPLSLGKNLFQSFAYAVLGPFPWQINSLRQLFVLLETIPWYFLLFFIAKGIIVSVKKNRVVVLLIVFSFLSFSVVALFLSNFGIITRIRMPAFVTLLCFLSFGLEKLNNIKIKFLEKYV